METRLKNVPLAVVNAQLPQNYEAAKMADDKKLEKYATRVRARAIRRCGELLQTIEKQQGKRTDLQPHPGTGTRLQVAEDAGLSRRKKDTALQVANVPEADFDEAVESDSPPTITALAERGTKKYKTPAEIIGDRDPADFQAAIHALGGLRRFVEMTQQYGPAAIIRGSDARGRAEMIDLVQQIPQWITNLTRHIGEVEHAEKAKTTPRRTAQG